MMMIVTNIQSAGDNALPANKIRAKIKDNTITIISGDKTYELKVLSYDKVAKAALKELCATLSRDVGIKSDELREDLLARLGEGKNVFRMSKLTQNEEDKRVKIEYATTESASGTERSSKLAEIDRNVEKMSQANFFQLGLKKTSKRAVEAGIESIKKSAASETDWKSVHVAEPQAGVTTPSSEDVKAIFEAIQGNHASHDKGILSIGNALTMEVPYQIERDLGNVYGANTHVEVGGKMPRMETLEEGRTAWFHAVKGIRGEAEEPLSDRTAVDIMGIMGSQTFFGGIWSHAMELYGESGEKVVQTLQGAIPHASVSIVGDRLVITRSRDFCVMDPIHVSKNALKQIQSAEGLLKLTQTISIPLATIERAQKHENGLKELQEKELEVAYVIKKASPQEVQQTIRQARQKEIEAGLMETWRGHAARAGSKQNSWVVEGAANTLMQHKAIKQIIAKHAKHENALTPQTLQKIAKEIAQKISKANKRTIFGSNQDNASNSLRETWRTFCKQLNIYSTFQLQAAEVGKEVSQASPVDVVELPKKVSKKAANKKVVIESFFNLQLRKENLESKLKRDFIRYAKQQGFKGDLAFLRSEVDAFMQKPALQELIIEYAKKENLQAIPQEILQKRLQPTGRKRDTRPGSVSADWQAFCQTVGIPSKGKLV